MKPSVLINVLVGLACVVLLGLLLETRQALSRTNETLGVAERALAKASDRIVDDPWFTTRFVDVFSFRNLPPVVSEEVFGRGLLESGGISNEEDFTRVVEKSFDEHAEGLATAWEVEDRNLLWAFYSMNLVSGLWGYGNANPEHVDEVGCVASNETTGFEARDPLPFSAYFESEIGCCTDSADLMEILLTSRGIRNRTISDGGHVFNEAWIDDRFQIFDATLNLSVDRSWEYVHNEMNLDPNSVSVTLFAHPNMIEVGNPLFRPALGQFRMVWLLRLIKKISVNPEVYAETQARPEVHESS